MIDETVLSDEYEVIFYTSGFTVVVYSYQISANGMVAAKKIYLIK